MDRAAREPRLDAVPELNSTDNGKEDPLGGLLFCHFTVILQKKTSNRTSNQTTNSAANEHKHPNQYTKGADDESAKNSVNSRSAKNSR